MSGAVRYSDDAAITRKQWLKGFGGALVPASAVRVYRVKKDGKPGERLIRIEPPTYFSQDLKGSRAIRGTRNE